MPKINHGYFKQIIVTIQLQMQYLQNDISLKIQNLCVALFSCLSIYIAPTLFLHILIIHILPNIAQRTFLFRGKIYVNFPLLFFIYPILIFILFPHFILGFLNKIPGKPRDGISCNYLKKIINKYDDQDCP